MEKKLKSHDDSKINQAMPNKQAKAMRKPLPLAVKEPSFQVWIE